MKKEDLKLENGKIVIESDEVLKQISEQGMNFTDDGSLNLEDGANFKIHFEIS